jgi:lactate permease
MPWQQLLDPFDNIYFSALAAIIPILYIFYALIVRKMKGHVAGLSSLLVAALIAVFVYRMPIGLVVISSLHGALYAVFPICWIIIAAVFLFNLTVRSGRFDIIRSSMASISEDRRLQVLLIAFSFGSFLEGTSGFGTPVAITASMLVALGFNPLYAAGICLIANTAPVAFGSIGIPITVASQVSGLPEMAISKMVGRTLPLVSFITPFYLVMIVAGWKKTKEVWPAIFVCGFAFAFFQWLTSNYLGPLLPDIIAGIASIISLVTLLRFWKPAHHWDFENKPETSSTIYRKYTPIQQLKGWSPFIILTILVLTWGLPPVKGFLNQVGYTEFKIPGLHENIIAADHNNPLPQVYKFNWLSAAGTAIFLSAIFALPLLGVRLKDACIIFLQTLWQLRLPVLTIASILAFSFVMNNAGMTLTIANLLIHTGWLYPFFAPILGWLGVFVTGSDTSSNALFSKIQASTATALGVDPVITVGANISGGVVGKMISPQSIAVATAATKLVGRESDLFRFTFKHSLLFLLLICILTLLQAYIFTWLIPIY